MGNLHNLILMTITKHNAQLAALWDKHSPIKQPTNLLGDMVKVNDYFRLKLGIMDEDTVRVRECLTNEATAMDWIKNFEKGVLPFLLTHSLPGWN